MRSAMIVAWAMVLIANLLVAQSPPARGGAGDPATLADLPAVARYAVSAAVGKDRPAYHVRAEGETLRTRNAGTGIAAEFGPQGVSILAGTTRLGLRLVAFGFGKDLRTTGAGTRAVSENRVEFRREQLTEWYVNGPLGLQHGFTVNRRPEGAKDETLTVMLELTGGLRAVLDADATGLTLVDAAGTARLRYTGLTAYDADERTLPARLEAEHGNVRIRVDARGACYPLVIDPLFQTAELKASDAQKYDFLSCSVAIHGDTIVAGAYGDDNGTNYDQGSAYVFVKPAGGWKNMTQTAKLTAADGARNDQFGYSVAIHGDTIVAGAHQKLIGTKASQGRAYVFVKPTGGWKNMTQTARLGASDGAASDHFGYSVAIHGDTIVVGANLDDIVSNADQGSAYVFVKPSTGWQSTYETAKLTASDGTATSYFGYTVAVSGDTILAGAWAADVGNNKDQGAAYVFVKPAAGWKSTTQAAKLVAKDGAADDHFAGSVSISGDTIVCGSVLDDDKGTASGSAYVFVKPAGGWSGTVTQTAKLLASDGRANDRFGAAVAVSGNTIVVGAIWHYYVGTKNGAAYVFMKPAGGWKNMTEAYKLTSPVRGSQQYFGLSVAVSGDTILAGKYAWASVYVHSMTSLIGSGSPRPGGAVTLDLRALLDPGLPCQLASSLGTGPIQIDTRQIDLSADWMFLVSVWNMLPTVFSNYAGKIGANGTAKATLNIPNITGLVGLTIHSAFVTVSPSAPSGIKSISRTASFKIAN